MGLNRLGTGNMAPKTDTRERKREEQLRVLGYSVANLIADAQNSADAIKAVMRTICEAERWECGRYLQPQGQAGILRVAEAWSIDQPQIREFIDRSLLLEHQSGIGLVGEVWQSGHALWVRDMSKDARALGRAHS